MCRRSFGVLFHGVMSVIALLIVSMFMMASPASAQVCPSTGPECTSCVDQTQQECPTSCGGGNCLHLSNFHRVQGEVLNGETDTFSFGVSNLDDTNHGTCCDVRSVSVYLCC